MDNVMVQWFASLSNVVCLSTGALPSFSPLTAPRGTNFQATSYLSADLRQKKQNKNQLNRPCAASCHDTNNHKEGLEMEKTFLSLSSHLREDQGGGGGGGSMYTLHVCMSHLCCYIRTEVWQRG